MTLCRHLGCRTTASGLAVPRGLTQVRVPLCPAHGGPQPQEIPMPRPSSPLVFLRPDADAHPELCREDGCELPPDSRHRGLCLPSYRRARSQGRLDIVALPALSHAEAAHLGAQRRAARTLEPPTVAEPPTPAEAPATPQEPEVGAEPHLEDGHTIQGVPLIEAVESYSKTVAILRSEIDGLLRENSRLHTEGTDPTGKHYRAYLALDDIRCAILDSGHPLGDDSDPELTPLRLVQEVLSDLVVARAEIARLKDRDQWMRRALAWRSMSDLAIGTGTCETDDLALEIAGKQLNRVPGLDLLVDDLRTEVATLRQDLSDLRRIPSLDRADLQRRLEAHSMLRDVPDVVSEIPDDEMRSLARDALMELYRGIVWAGLDEATRPRRPARVLHPSHRWEHGVCALCDCHEGDDAALAFCDEAPF